MTRPGFADAEHLIHWADRFDAKAELSRLVRGLILETGQGVTQLGFRAGAGVYQGGWDGTVCSAESTTHIPKGLSLWELSTRKDVKRKADQDYGKELVIPDGSDPTSCTYVEVTLRRWNRKDEWAEARRAEGRWKDVRSYDVDDLVTWLETAQVTHAWVSELLGLSPHGLRAGQAWWGDWSNATDPPLPASLVLAGRENAARELLERLSGEPQVISLQSASLEESLAFVFAVALQAAAGDQGRLFGRIAFVDRLEAWRSLLVHRNPLVLVARSQEVAREIPSNFNHHLIVPLTGPGEADVELPPLNSHKASQALKEAGMDDKDAENYGRLARLSLLALRRRLAIKPELLRPDWASRPIQATIRRLLLAERWNESKDGDQRVVGNLVGEGYNRLREELSGLVALEDPFLAAVGVTWGVVSPYDAWLLLRDDIRPDDFQRFQTAVQTVLHEVNPAFELPIEERWRAAIHGKERQYSTDMRYGLATTLALLGAHGANMFAGTAQSGADWANLLVREVLDEANSELDGRLWSSLEDILPLLAEAAPEPFLDAVRDGLNGDRPVLIAMFTGQKSETLFAHSPHTGLLWALEGVAWSADHFGQVVDLMAKLAELDPGGRLSNRPLGSLKSIFCPWFPQNSVTPERRFAVLDALRQRHAEISWQLLVALLPESHAIQHPTHEPRYRPWKPATMKSVKVPEYLSFTEEVVGRLLEDVGTEAERWLVLLEKMDDLPPTSRASLQEKLGHVLQVIEPEGLAKLWEKLRAVIANNRAFADAKWALPAQEVDALEELAKQLTPTDLLVEHAGLFQEHRPDLPDRNRRGGDLKEYLVALDERRREAVIEIEASAGWQGLLRLAESSKLPWTIGIAMADAEMSQYEEGVLSLLDSQRPADINLATGYLTRCFLLKGWAWADALFKESLPATQKGRVLVCTREFPKAWEIAEEMGVEVKVHFWKHFPAFGLGEDFSHACFASEQMMRVGRNAAALDLLHLYLNEHEQVERQANLIITGLEQLASSSEVDPEMNTLSHHSIVGLFEFLQNNDEVDWQQLAKLEWAYSGLLDFGGRLQTLHRLMSENPDFFVDLLSKVYRANDEEPAELTDDQAMLAENAYRVLSNWRTIPGMKPDGSIDGVWLRKWVAAVRKKLEEVKRLEVGDLNIGEVLASSPAGDDGFWPAPTIRNLIEELQSADIERGLETQLYNNRGVTSRAPGEGGQQERDLAASFREQADALADKWPRTAAVLRSLANGYDRQARRQDDDAERFRSGFDN